MKTILRIGYAFFVLPASANVNAIIGVLNKATPVELHYSGSQKIYTPASERDQSRVSIEMVDDEQVIDPKSKKTKAIPEKAGPDRHNTF